MLVISLAGIVQMQLRTPVYTVPETLLPQKLFIQQPTETVPVLVGTITTQ